MKMRTGRTILLTASATVLAISLSGCSVIDGLLGSGFGDVTRDEATGQVTEGANVDVFALKLGDCKMTSPSGLISDADVVPCDQPHDEEIYHEITMEDGTFSDAGVDAASEGCIGDAFTQFIGIAYNDSTLMVSPLTPTEDTWNNLNDRVIQCMISDPAGPITGTLAGVAR